MPLQKQSHLNMQISSLSNQVCLSHSQTRPSVAVEMDVFLNTAETAFNKFISTDEAVRGNLVWEGKASLQLVTDDMNSSL